MYVCMYVRIYVYIHTYILKCKKCNWVNLRALLQQYWSSFAAVGLFYGENRALLLR